MKKQILTIALLLTLGIGACTACGSAQTAQTTSTEQIVTAESTTETTEAEPTAETDAAEQTDQAEQTEEQLTLALSGEGSDDLELFYETSSSGLVKTIRQLRWIAERGGAGISGESIEVTESENTYLEESSAFLDSGEEVLSKGTEQQEHVWLRLQQTVAPEEETTETGCRDFLLYEEGEDAYLAVQSYDEPKTWTLYRLPGYGKWLECEIAMAFRMYTGL